MSEKSVAYIEGAWHIADGFMLDEFLVLPDDEPPFYEKDTQEYNDWKLGCRDEYNGHYDVYKLYKESFNKLKGE